MIEKIKSYGSYALSLAVVILGVFLSFRNRKLKQVESELVTERSNSVVKESDHDREIAKHEADDLVDSYDRLKHEYDTASHGAGGDSDL